MAGKYATRPSSRSLVKVGTICCHGSGDHRRGWRIFLLSSTQKRAPRHGASTRRQRRQRDSEVKFHIPVLQHCHIHPWKTPPHLSEDRHSPLWRSSFSPISLTCACIPCFWRFCLSCAAAAVETMATRMEKLEGKPVLIPPPPSHFPPQRRCVRPRGRGHLAFAVAQSHRVKPFDSVWKPSISLCVCRSGWALLRAHQMRRA